jgi:hypothetical protein
VVTYMARRTGGKLVILAPVAEPRRAADLTAVGAALGAIAKNSILIKMQANFRWGQWSL